MPVKVGEGSKLLWQDTQDHFKQPLDDAGKEIKGTVKKLKDADVGGAADSAAKAFRAVAKTAGSAAAQTETAQTTGAPAAAEEGPKPPPTTDRDDGIFRPGPEEEKSAIF